MQEEEKLEKQTIRHKRFDELVSNISNNLDTFIYGPTGSGKSRAVKEAAKLLNIPFYKKLVGNQSSEVSIIGYNDAGGRYVEGIAYKPFVEGGILLIDEIDNGNPNTNLVINGLTDREMAFPCGMKTANENFILITTANTLGNGATLEYCGRNRIDGALLNRLIFIPWTYDSVLEESLAKDEYKKSGGLKDDELMIMLNDIRKMREALNEMKINHILSPRNSLQAARKLAVGRSKIEILQSVLLKGMDNDTAKKLLTKAKEIRIIDDIVNEQKEWFYKVINDSRIEEALNKNPFDKTKYV